MASPSVGHSGFGMYNPISNLERQCAAPVGGRVHLFIKANPNCCLPGGVEALLKMNTKSTGINTPLSTLDSDVTTVATEASTASGASDPFSFLNDGDSSARAPPLDAAPAGKKNKPLSFLKNTLKKTQAHIERGMTGLAIRADQGRNPDYLIVGLHDSAGQVLSMTEAAPMPIDDAGRLNGVGFYIPLVIPPGWGNDDIVTLKLWIKSGAVLLKKQHFLLGQTHLSIGQLKTGLADKAVMRAVPLQSHVVVDGQLQLLLSKDLKFPALMGRGWSLTDPDMSGYTQNALYHWPLDQSYGYIPPTGAKWLVATERATESTVVLPVALMQAKLFQKACQVSLTHATSVLTHLAGHRHETNEGHKATCNLAIGYLLIPDANRSVALSLHWQRPDSIFEVEIMGPTKIPVQTVQVPFQPSLNLPFFPRVCSDGILPSVLAQYSQKPAFLLGNIRLQLNMTTAKANGTSNPFDQLGPGSQAVNAESEMWQATFALESYINRAAGEPVQVPVYNTMTGAQMGSLVLSLVCKLADAGPQAIPPLSTSNGGLVSLMGLDSLMETMGISPNVDSEVTPIAPGTNPANERRHQQLSTMGHFMTPQYLVSHITTTRTADMSILMDRVEKYQLALSFNPQADLVEPHQIKTPMPFRPSSSRSTLLLSGIPFNVHNVTLAMESMPGAEQGGVFENVTCGAPSDHARGYGAVYPGGPTGGLRRLEAGRLELQQRLQESQSALIHAVATYFVSARSANQKVLHIPARHQEIAQLRWKVFTEAQNLHQLTWTCAIRRANVFSQALGIALTSFLANLSDTQKMSSGWADVWVKHGYLVCYEGLLSAAGKEKGMIEDASTGIGMLRMVTMQLVETEGPEDKVVIPNSPYLKWLHMSPSGVGSKTQYRLTLGIDPHYYQERISPSLKNGGTVQFYPLLFQVGVDIHQWGAHTQAQVTKQVATNYQQATMSLKGESTSTVQSEVQSTDGGVIDDDDDDAGAADEDFLIALNFEALRKMDAYAHAISPMAPAVIPPMLHGSTPQPPPAQVHPVLTHLHSHVMSSAGKMNHGILDEAASVAQKLGGGGVVFCKSGKDRTAMHVTFKQAQFVHQCLLSMGRMAPPDIYEDATRMRVYGTRLPVCEKNVGQAKYAFNALQVRFMPEMLKPPVITLAGFLKGGAVFKGGGIES
jgi:hypothetical protein